MISLQAHPSGWAFSFQQVDGGNPSAGSGQDNTNQGGSQSGNTDPDPDDQGGGGSGNSGFDEG